MLAAAAAPIPFLLPRAGLLWSVPVLAPLLGTIALAPAFIGVAALASDPARRAGLAAAGLCGWRSARCSPGKALLFGAPDGASCRARTGRARSRRPRRTRSARSSRPPRCCPRSPGRPARWCSPLVVRGRWLAVDLLGAGAWAAALIAAHAALGDVLAADVALDHARGGVAGCDRRRARRRRRVPRGRRTAALAGAPACRV